jgi:hypothetical protein
MGLETVAITAGAGTGVQVDDVGSSVKVQVVKIGVGAAGALDNVLDAGQQAASASLPVVAPAAHIAGMTTLPAGTNNIGGVDVLTVPADPFGANADAASSTGSISAKLRFMADSKYTVISQTPTVTAGAYTAKWAVGGLLTFANAGATSGATIEIDSVVVTDLAAQKAELVLVLFDRTFTATADAAAFDPSDADMANCVGQIVVPAANYNDFVDNAVGSVKNINLLVKLSGTSLFGQMMCTGTPTYVAATDVTVKVGIRRV